MKFRMAHTVAFACVVCNVAAGLAADGWDDLLISRPAGGCWVYLNDQGPGLAFDGYWGSINPDPQDLPLAGDFDGDGWADLARYRPSAGGAMWVYLNSGVKTFTYAGQWISGGLMTLDDVMLAGDWNGDGIWDLAVYKPSGGFFDMIVGDGSGGFAWFGYWPLSGHLAGDAPIAGDFNGDGFTDVLMIRSGNGIVGDADEFDQGWLYINGQWEGVAGWQSAGRVFNGDLWDDGDALHGGDLTGDGFDDLLVTRDGNGLGGDPDEFDQVFLYENDHFGAFSYLGRLLNGEAWEDGDFRLFADFDRRAASGGFDPECGDASHPYPPGDLNQDCYVDWQDFTIFASYWLSGGCTDPQWCGGADLNASGQVDWQDFTLFAGNWLTCTDPQPPCSYNPATAAPGGYNHDFRRGSLDGWLVIGDAFFAAHEHNGLLPWKGGYHLWSQEYYATSDQPAATGAIRSGNFRLATVDPLTFYIAGMDGSGPNPLGLNYVRLVRLSDQQVLFEELCPQSSSWKRVVWDIFDHVGTEVYLEIGDGNSDATDGWIAVDDFELGSDQVLSPWTAVSADGEAIDCWGRSYRWGQLPFPQQVTTQGRDILAGPIRFAVSVAGQPVAWTANGTQEPATLTSPTGVAAKIARSVEGSGLRVDGQAVVEFDGMTRIDFTIQPTSSPLQVDQFVIEIPFRPEFARLMYLWYQPFYGDRTSGQVPSTLYSTVFHPLCWIGNETGGLLWFAESDEGWLPADNPGAIRIVPGGQETVLQLRVWDAAHTISGPQRFSMGLQADPVKPWPDDWHQQHIAGNVWWYADADPEAVYWAEVEYPGEGNFSKAQGTIEMWLKPLFDPRVPGSGEYNRAIFMVNFDNGDHFNFYWNATGPSLTAYVATGGQSPGFTMSTHWWDPNEWHYLAVTWDSTQMNMWLDGVKKNVFYHNDLFSSCGNPVSMRLGRVCDFVVDELRVSNVYRTSFDLVDPPAVDADTLLLDRFEEDFRPDGVRRTRAAFIWSGSGGLVFKGVRFVPGKFGRAVSLRSRLGISPLQYLSNLGYDLIACGENWTAVQNYVEPWCCRPASGGTYCSCENSTDDIFGSVVDEIHSFGLGTFPYFGFEFSDIAPEWPAYSDECLFEPRPAEGYRRYASGGVPPQESFPVCYRSRYADLLIDGMEQVKSKYGIDGVYLDATTIPLACVNQLHGCGYVNGTVKPVYAIFPTRTLLKRINALFAQDGGIVEAHIQMSMNLPAVSFATCAVDGEWFYIYGSRGQPILNYIPLASYRAHFGRHWGVPFRLLDPGTDPFTDEELMSMTMLQDVLVRPSNAVAGQLEEIRDTEQVFVDFGADQADWFGYWDNGAYVSTSNPGDVKVSFFRRADTNSLLLIVSNLGSQDLDTAWIDIDYGALGLPVLNSATTWPYGLDAEPLTVVSGRIHLSLPRWTPSLIWVMP